MHWPDIDSANCMVRTARVVIHIDLDVFSIEAEHCVHYAIIRHYSRQYRYSG